MNWTKVKPDFPCLFLTRAKFHNRYNYSFYILEMLHTSEGSYLGWLNGDGEEYGDLADLYAEEYLVIERTDSGEKGEGR